MQYITQNRWVYINWSQLGRDLSLLATIFDFRKWSTGNMIKFEWFIMEIFIPYQTWKPLWSSNCFCVALWSSTKRTRLINYQKKHQLWERGGGGMQNSATGAFFNNLFFRRNQDNCASFITVFVIGAEWELYEVNPLYIHCSNLPCLPTKLKPLKQQYISFHWLERLHSTIMASYP